MLRRSVSEGPDIVASCADTKMFSFRNMNALSIPRVPVTFYAKGKIYGNKYMEKYMEKNIEKLSDESDELEKQLLALSTSDGPVAREINSVETNNVLSQSTHRSELDRQDGVSIGRTCARERRGVRQHVLLDDEAKGAGRFGMAAFLA